MIYLADILPGLLIKFTAPFWFDRVSYDVRMFIASTFMFLSYFLVGTGSVMSNGVLIQLLGVCFASAQAAVGGCSMLALSSRYPQQGSVITAWSSGTGFAGIFGFAWVVVFNVWFDYTFQTVLYLAITLVFIYSGTFFMFLPPPPTNDFSQILDQPEVSDEEEQGEGTDEVELLQSTDEENDVVLLRTCKSRSKLKTNKRTNNSSSSKSSALKARAAPVKIEMTFGERLKFMGSLWKITGALFLVYFSEYAMQSGKPHTHHRLKHF